MNAPAAVMEFITHSLGMEQGSAGKDAVRRAVAFAMRQEGVSDAREYEKLFLSSPAARQKLIDAVVVGETWFFRDRGPFLWLARHARQWLETHPGSTLKILSSPCATGEEPYSIVMTLLAAGLPPSAFTVEGVDATSGPRDGRPRLLPEKRFPGSIGEDVARFFETTPSGRKVAEAVASLVSFSPENLALPGSLAGRGPYDIIFCRNLLIYMTPEARLRIFDRMNRLLIPGGLLFTGHTETNFWHQRGYQLLPWDRAFALAKPASPAQPAAIRTKAPTKPSVRPGENFPRKTGAAAQEATSSPSNTGQGKTAGKGRGQPAKSETASENFKLSQADEQIQEARRLADTGGIAPPVSPGMHAQIRPGCRSLLPDGNPSPWPSRIRTARRTIFEGPYLDPGTTSLNYISLIAAVGNEKAALYREQPWNSRK